MKYKNPKRKKHKRNKRIFKKEEEDYIKENILGVITKFILILIISIFSIKIKGKTKYSDKSDKMKVALCTMGRNEILYINEFVSFHLKLGVDTLYIYDDNIEEKEKFINAITPNDSVVIEYTKDYGIKDLGQAFTHCYNKHKDDYDWIIMTDMDEYLIIKNNQTLKEYLSDKVFDKCDSIKIHWKMSSDNNLLHYENKSLFERFKEPYLQSDHIKSVMRGGITGLVYYQHSPLKADRNVSCDNTGRLLNYTKINIQSVRPYNTDRAYILHFYFKSTEEYINKFKRGYKDWPQSKLDGWILNYFKQNKITIEKIEMLEKAFNITLEKYRKKLK